MSDNILRYNEGKPQLSYILQFGYQPCAEVADVMAMGAKKYARNNWKNGGPNASVEALSDCLLRHTAKLLDGEEIDQESGKHHAAHIICNAFFILFHYFRRKASEGKREEQ